MVDHATRSYIGKAIVQKGRGPKRWPGDEGEEYYFFALVAFNNEIIAQSEQYSAKQSATELIHDYFMHFELVDETGE